MLNLIEKYISTHPSHTENAAYQTDRLSRMILTGEVLFDTDKNEPYDVRPKNIDVSYDVYEFLSYPNNKT
jgi:hypothetical protein